MKTILDRANKMLRLENGGEIYVELLSWDPDEALLEGHVPCGGTPPENYHRRVPGGRREDPDNLYSIKKGDVIISPKFGDEELVVFDVEPFSSPEMEGMKFSAKPLRL